jgi:hypothetical protein
MIELTIKRPNGEIEKVATEFAGMTKVLFGKIQEATRNAGRGEVLSWELVDTRTDEEKQALAKQDAIERIKSEMAKCRDYDNKRYIELRGDLEALTDK